MCCCGYEDKPEKGDEVTECEECGTELINGDPSTGCAYSPVCCDTCGWHPCDGSC